MKQFKISFVLNQDGYNGTKIIILVKAARTMTMTPKMPSWLLRKRTPQDYWR